MSFIYGKCPNCRSVNEFNKNDENQEVLCPSCGDTFFCDIEESSSNQPHLIDEIFVCVIVTALMYFFSKWWGLILFPYAIAIKGEMSGSESCGCLVFLFLGLVLAAEFDENVFIGVMIVFSLGLLLSKSPEKVVQVKTASTRTTSSYKKTNNHSRSEAINWALNILDNDDNCFILDTETTGLRETDEVIEIGIIDMDGNTVFHSYIKPLRRKSIPAAAAKIHGITMAKLKGAPTMIDIHPQIRNLLKGRIVIAYNASFDKRLLKQTFDKYDLSSLTKVVWQDAMVPYSNFVGSSKWVKLPGATHGTLDDCQAVLTIIKEMTQAKI
jgi:inhibitor of KinA sporulation pathway (predicted exonuclease)